MIRFENYAELSDALCDRLFDKLNSEKNDNVSVSFGTSNQSCSRYVNLWVDYVDEEGDECQEFFKVRFSDHPDRYGADLTIRFDNLVTAVEDECGEFDYIEIEQSDFDNAFEEALEASKKFIAQFA